MRMREKEGNDKKARAVMRIKRRGTIRRMAM